MTIAKYTTNRERRKQRVIRYLELDNPPPLKGWLKEHHMFKQTFDKIQGELLAEKKVRTKKVIKEEVAHKKELANMLGDQLTESNYDSDGFLDLKVHKVDKALLTACERGNATALKIFYQLTNRLVEKSEQGIKVGLDADEITRRNLEADKQLREAGYS